MFINDDFELIITIVNRGCSDGVMDAAKAAGATGGTILNARGSGVHEAEKFFGVSIQPEKEVILILVKKAQKREVMKEISKNCGLFTEGHGICFSLPVEDVIGIVHMTAQDAKKTDETDKE